MAIDSVACKHRAVTRTCLSDSWCKNIYVGRVWWLNASVAVQALDNRSEASLHAAGLQCQQGESSARECQDFAEEDVVLVPDSDDDDSLDTSQQALPMSSACRQEHHEGKGTATVPDQASQPDQASAPDQAFVPEKREEPDQAAEPHSEAAPYPDDGITDDGVAARGSAADDRPEVCSTPLLALNSTVQIAMKCETWSHAKCSGFAITHESFLGSPSTCGLQSFMLFCYRISFYIPVY